MWVRVFLTIWIVYLFHWSPYIVREHFPALALAYSGSLNTIEYVGWTTDIFRVSETAAYINNNPGASIVGAVPLFIFRPALETIKRWNAEAPLPRSLPTLDSNIYRKAIPKRLEIYFFAVAFVTVAGAMAPIGAAAFTFLTIRLLQFGLSERAGAIAALACAFGTPVFFRTGHLNHNLLVGHFALVSLLCLWKPGEERIPAHRLILGGLAAGFTVLCDFTGLLVVGVYGLYVLYRGRPFGNKTSLRWGAVFGAACLPGILALLLYQQVAFGSSVLPSQHYMPAIEQTAQGYRGIGWPSLDLLWANFVDPRFGLFTYCPALLLAFAAPFVKNTRFPVPKREQALLFALFAAFVIFCAMNQYSWLQPLTGFRYLVPIVPGMMLLSLHVIQAVPKALAWSIGVASVAWCWMAAMTYDYPFVAATEVLQGGPTLSSIEMMRKVGTPPPFGHEALRSPLLILSLCALLVLIVWTLGRMSDNKKLRQTAMSS